MLFVRKPDLYNMYMCLQTFARETLPCQPCQILTTHTTVKLRNFTHWINTIQGLSHTDNKQNFKYKHLLDNFHDSHDLTQTMNTIS